jgi:hypothetical protein
MVVFAFSIGADIAPQADVAPASKLAAASETDKIRLFFLLDFSSVTEGLLCSAIKRLLRSNLR